jgi:NTE family protein
VKRWARDLSTLGRPVTPHYIQVGFRDLEQPEARHFFNQIPTSFDLSDEQVDRLIAAGRELLRNNPDYRRLVAALGGSVSTR